MQSPVVLRNSKLNDTFYSSGNNRYKAAIHYMNYCLSIFFPKTFPIIMVTGYPKSGTVWVSKMVADYLQLPFIDLSIFPSGCPAVIHGHRRVRRNGPRMVYVVRDGRDCMVSMYFYLSRFLPEGNSPVIPDRLSMYFKGITNKNDVKGFLPVFIKRQLASPLGAHVGWHEHVLSYVSSARKDIPLIKYEDLLKDTFSTMKSAFRVLDEGIVVDDQLLEFTVQKFSFEKVTGRKKGDENNMEFVRKGISGDWRNYFTREAAEVFNSLAGKSLIDLGYETSNAWVGTVPQN